MTKPIKHHGKSVQDQLAAAEPVSVAATWQELLSGLA
ncbi:MAG: hypothetical protein RL033_4381 [Pseudomonadota bacterium]|jgi:hypothetical protein